MMIWTITAGTVCSAGWLLTAAPVGADSDQDGPPGRSEPPARGARIAPQRDESGTRPGGRGRTEVKPPRPEDCHDWPYWPPVPPAPDLDNRNVFFLGDDGAAPAIPPLALVTASTITSRTDLETDESPDAPATLTSASEPLSVGAPGQTARIRPGLPQGGPMIPAPPPPRPPAPPPAPPPFPPPAIQPAPMPRAADLTDTLGPALPGLVGLAALTGAGGLLGYRQAKAGFALRAAGTARYLP